MSKKAIKDMTLAEVHSHFRSAKSPQDKLTFSVAIIEHFDNSVHEQLIGILEERIAIIDEKMSKCEDKKMREKLKKKITDITKERKIYLGKIKAFNVKYS